MKTKTGRAGRGFTIIEVMIFLAVSGFMFILAAIFINGKQANVAYHQGMQAAASAVTNVINTVANGEYPPFTTDQSCVSGGAQPSFQRGSLTQGSNQGCIFVGKIMEFGTDPTKTQYETYTVVGCQYQTCNSTELSQSLTGASPVLGPPNLTQTATLEDGLTFSNAWLCQPSVPCSAIAGLMFYGSFTGAQNFAQQTQGGSGAQSVAAATLTTIPTDDTTQINPTLPGGFTLLGSGAYAVLCFSLGNQEANVIIGGAGGQQSSVTVNYGKQAPCT